MKENTYRCCLSWNIMPQLEDQNHSLKHITSLYQIHFNIQFSNPLNFKDWRFVPQQKHIYLRKAETDGYSSSESDNITLFECCPSFVCKLFKCPNTEALTDTCCRYCDKYTGYVLPITSILYFKFLEFVYLLIIKTIAATYEIKIDVHLHTLHTTIPKAEPKHIQGRKR